MPFDPTWLEQNPTAADSYIAYTDSTMHTSIDGAKPDWLSSLRTNYTNDCIMEQWSGTIDHPTDG